MIALDTNVLVRYIMQDDVNQSPKATKLIDSLIGAGHGYITLVSVIELVRVLSSCYDLTRDQVAQALDAVLRTKQFVVKQADQAIRALRTFKAINADYADCLIERMASHAGCEKTMTFDADTGRHAGMTLVL